MKRKLGRFGKCTQKYQEGEWRGIGWSARISSPLESTTIDVVGTDGLADEDYAAQQCQSTGTRDRQAMRAPLRASLRWCQYPISKKELILVSSQKNQSNSRLFASTMPTMDAMNSNR
jgi:hypothetical protein